MQKLRVALILMIIFVAVASWYKNQRREEPAAVTQEATLPINMDGAPSPSPGTLPTTSTVKAETSTLTPENQKIVRECLAKDPTLPRVNLTDGTSLDDIYRDLSPKIDSVKMNMHVRRADGREERILVQPHEPTSKQTFKIESSDVRVFNVDKEGLPVTKAFPRELRVDTVSHALNVFVGSDKATFTERRADGNFAGGSATSVETNGKLTELQLNFGRTTLGCAWQNRLLNCACL